jgi:hypothetical protein
MKKVIWISQSVIAGQVMTAAWTFITTTTHAGATFHLFYSTADLEL